MKKTVGRNHKKWSLYGMLLALAMVLSYVEAILPFSIGIPGVKLGLPNLVSVIGLFSIGLAPTVLISLLRICLVAVSFGNAMTLAYSFAGWLLSMCGMLLMRRMRFALSSVSVAGGILHNVGQIAVAVWLLRAPVLFAYLPLLLLAGAASGALIGLLGAILLKRVRTYLYSGQAE